MVSKDQDNGNKISQSSILITDVKHQRIARLVWSAEDDLMVEIARRKNNTLVFIGHLLSYRSYFWLLSSRSFSSKIQKLKSTKENTEK